MGLTIHYNFKSSTQSSHKAQVLVEKMRQLAMDLAFEEVRDIKHLGPEICQIPLDHLRGNETMGICKDEFGEVLDGCTYVDIPWHRKRHGSVTVQPLDIISFVTIPGPGSEWAAFGLARYPQYVEVTRRPQDEDRFTRTIKDGGSTRWAFDWGKWSRWLLKNGYKGYESPDIPQFKVKVKIPVRRPGWRWSSFCKTQYASNPDCGGIPNFIRCHLSVIHLLDRIAQLPTMKVETDDEGKYGRSHYTDDWRVPEPIYTWHEGKYDVRALVEEVGGWDEMIAATCGALNDALGASGGIISPITKYPTYEHLEFKGQHLEHLSPFLKSMQELASRKQV